ncbi:MAG: hypothetical protein DRO87_06050 [Candidatus Thorarchaeota archaeon]|nr:MAG: hypothetical protein DRP09_09075 [Candidatus Thorarchaeota archaeon]RLI58142.1 MAG: hypothetical protein DRO87_06050 [Candidatus Thorarchaeota archaeon]
MPSLELLLFGLSAVLMVFVLFSVMKGLRYATIAFDMIKVYPALLAVSYIGMAIGLLAVFPLLPYIALVLLLTVNTAYWLREPVRWLREYRLSNLRHLFETLQSETFNVASFDDYVRGELDPTRVNVFLRHDVDISLPRARRLASMQKELGVLSTYFFRLHAEKYTFEEAQPVIRELVEWGFGIGLHYETLSFTKGDKERAIEQFAQDLQALRDFAPVSIVAAHGHRQYKNRQIWEYIDKSTLDVFSAYDMKSDIYISDAGGRRLRDEEGKHLFDRLYEAKPGQIVQVLIHPDWWA